jgi:hypothetical protein
VATVNAVTVGGYVEGRLLRASVGVGVGADVLVPLGGRHVAFTGRRALQMRPVPYVVAVAGPVDLGVGFVVPYHLAAGGHLTVAVIGPLVVRGGAWYGLPFAARRPDGSQWQGLPIGTAAAGLGLRLR